jgi:7-carboxy-7-deazaguanine synthase
MENELPVNEIFGPTIQGEGPLVGARTLFVRFAGCDFQCTWCDSKDTWARPIRRTKMSGHAILAELMDRSLEGSVRNVVLSGGNPALHDLGPLVATLQRENFLVAVETQGSIPVPAWFQDLYLTVLSPKGPSSGMPFNGEFFSTYFKEAENIAIKVVIFNDRDYDFALSVHHEYPYYPMFLSAGTYTPEYVGGKYIGAVQPISVVPQRTSVDNHASIIARTRALAEKAIGDERWIRDPIVGLQLHVLLWGHVKGV